MERLRNKAIVAASVLVIGLSAIAQGRVIYVDGYGARRGARPGGSGRSSGVNGGSSWMDSFVHLQNALAVAEGGDEIRVAQGLYGPDLGAGITPGDREASFHLVSGVAVAGGYAGLAGPDPNERDIRRYKTILSGDLNDDDGPGFANMDDNSVVVVSSFANDAATVLDGVTVVAGHGDEGAGVRCYESDLQMHRCTVSLNVAQTDGGGFVSYFGTPALTDCVFEDNRAGRHGAAVWSTGGDIGFRNCRFQRNTAGAGGGAIHHSGGNLDILRCRFVDNSTQRNAAASSPRGSGGAVSANLSFSEQVTATDCEFTGNSASSGGAIQGNVTLLTRCRFAGNRADERGGALDLGASLVAEDCIFAGNASLKKTAVAQCRGELTLTNCTLADNRAADGVALFAQGSHGSPVEMVLSHCIAWGGELDIYGGFDWQEHTSITYSDIQRGWPGEGNIDVDPLFVSPGYWDPNGTTEDLSDDVWIDGDYHLKSQAGRWDPAGEKWVQDDLTSPCIDAGDPSAPIGDECFPNGGIANLGAYGGTIEASRSYFGDPVCETHMAGDINGDCKVDFEDLSIVLTQWSEGTPPEITR